MPVEARQPPWEKDGTDSGEFIWQAAEMSLDPAAASCLTNAMGRKHPDPLGYLTRGQLGKLRGGLEEMAADFRTIIDAQGRRQAQRAVEKAMSYVDAEMRRRTDGLG